MGAEEAAAQARTLAAMLRAVPAMGAHAAAAPFVARALQPFCSPGARKRLLCLLLPARQFPETQSWTVKLCMRTKRPLLSPSTCTSTWVQQCIATEEFWPKT